MRILQLDITPQNQLKPHQDQNDYDLIVLQEKNVKDKLEIFKNWKRKFHSTFTEKTLGFSVTIVIRNDIKSEFANKMQPTLKLSGILLK